jgi:hypothetical protein
MKLLSIIVTIVLIISCSGGGRNSSSADQQSVQVGNAVEDFGQFNKRFHSEPDFQLSRVAFPIGGKYLDVEWTYHWTKDNWRLLKRPVSDEPLPNGYLGDVQRSDSSVIEKIWKSDSTYRSVRRFQLKNGKWFLTYYDFKSI